MIGFRILALASFTILTIGCTIYLRSSNPSGEAEKTSYQLMAARGTPPKTVITPYLEQRIEPGVNVVWCATFQMAWDKLKDIEGGDVKTSPDNVTVSTLNRESIGVDCLPRVGALSVAGLVRDGVVKDIEVRMGKLGRTPESTFLPASGSLPRDALIIYAYLARSLRYETPFASLRARPFSGAGGKVEYFGIQQYAPGSEAKKKQGNQIHILWHRFASEATVDIGQEFVIELMTTEKEDRLLLARVSPAYNLRESIDMVLRQVEHPNSKKTRGDGTAPEEQELHEALAGTPDPFQRDRIMKSLSGYCCLLPGEDVQIPSISIDCAKRVDDLMGLKVVSRKDKLNMKPIICAEQRIRFRLNETGANLESQAIIGLFGDGGIRDFSFTRPFLLLLMRQGARTPYFAVWIGNSELLVEGAGQVPIAECKEGVGG